MKRDPPERPERDDVEKFLREMDWCKPSAQLDERVSATVRKPVSMVAQRLFWLSGAAAAIVTVVTLSLLRAQPQVEAPVQPKVVQTPVEKKQALTTQNPLPVMNAVAKPVRIERLVTTYSEDDVQDAARNPYLRLVGRQVREVIWIAPDGTQKSQMLVPEGQVEVLRYAMY
jgi:hypothetical protein